MLMGTAAVTVVNVGPAAENTLSVKAVAVVVWTNTVTPMAVLRGGTVEIGKLR